MPDQPVPPNPETVPLLATRFFPPSQPAMFVSRARLLNRLETGLQKPLILVSASAGFGKSSLLAEWITHQTSLQASWLSLEASDNDWVRFFRYLVSAWQRIYPQAGATALAELRSFPPSQMETFADSLLNDLLVGHETGKFLHTLLALDDYHRIESPAIHETVAYLVEHLPPGCHLAILSRTDPPLPLARWRSRQQMLELRADDLRFIPAETVELFNQALRLPLDQEQIEILERRTEGWIVGLQLAAIALQSNLALQAHTQQGREDPRAFVEAFGGSHRYVLDYLVEEVLNSQPEEIQSFLLTTAPVDQFCGPLCDALLETASPYSQHMLERLEKANLFLVPLDGERRWFRYHHLFADLLKVRLQQENPNRLSELHRRGASWFAQNKAWREAIDYALQAKDYTLGTSLFEQAILNTGTDLLFSDVGPLVDRFPAEWIHSRPFLSLAKAAQMVMSSQLPGVRELLLAAENGIHAMSPFEGQAQALGIVHVIQGVAASLLGDNAWIISASQQVPKLLPNNPIANANALLQLGNVYFYGGDFHQVASCWQQALALSQTSRYTYGTLTLLDDLGRLSIHRGELNQAETFFQHALQMIHDEGGRFPRWMGAVQRDYSDLLRERNQLAEAQARMADGLELCEKWDLASGKGLAYIHMGRILLAQRDMPGAAVMLQKAEQLCQAHTVYPDLAAITQVFHARLCLANGDLQGAWQVLEACLHSPCCQHELHREWALIEQVRVLIHRGQHPDGLGIISARLDSAKKLGRSRNWLEMILLAALAYDGMGNQEQARIVLQEAVTFAQAQGFVRIFLDEGQRMRTLLEQFQNSFPDARYSSYTAALLSAFKAQTVSTPLQAGLSKNELLIEPLSARELEILGLVCEGLSNQEIARLLVLSVGTVKTHIHHIFGKLGVSNRPQAIARARQLEILPQQQIHHN